MLSRAARVAALSAPDVVALELRILAAGAFALINVFGGDAPPALTARKAAAAIIHASR